MLVRFLFIFLYIVFFFYRQDVRADIVRTMGAVEVLTTLFEQMEGEAARTADAFRTARDALAANEHLL